MSSPPEGSSTSELPPARTRTPSMEHAPFNRRSGRRRRRARRTHRGTLAASSGPAGHRPGGGASNWARSARASRPRPTRAGFCIGLGLRQPARGHPHRAHGPGATPLEGRQHRRPDPARRATARRSTTRPYWHYHRADLHGDPDDACLDPDGPGPSSEFATAQPGRRRSTAATRAPGRGDRGRPAIRRPTWSSAPTASARQCAT